MDGHERQTNSPHTGIDPRAVMDQHAHDLDSVPASRRGFLLIGISALVAGCAAQPTTTSSLPGPVWKPRTLPPDPGSPKPMPSPPSGGNTPPGMIARAKWSGGDPVPSLLNRMSTPQWITVHHEGSNPFYASDESSTRARLETIRRAHRANNWADIGYHYAVDRAGRLWECRSIQWQGAHVKDNNEANIGVMCLGNFERQAPTTSQLATLTKHVNWLMKHYRIASSRLRTHREWPSAATLCPGANLHRYMVTARSNRQFA